MPAKSQAQRKAMAIAEHKPGELYNRNRGMLSMSQSELHDYANTDEKGLPERRGKKKRKGFGLKKGY